MTQMIGSGKEPLRGRCLFCCWWVSRHLAGTSWGDHKPFSRLCFFWALPVSALWRINNTFRSGLELPLCALAPRWHLTDTFEQKIKGREGSKSHLASLHRRFTAMRGLEKEEGEDTPGRSSTPRVSILNEADRAFFDPSGERIRWVSHRKNVGRWNSRLKRKCL